jgi:hypothetical protein
MAALPLRRTETAENIPVCVQNWHQSVCATVAAAMYFLSSQIVTINTSQPIERLHVDLFK